MNPVELRQNLKNYHAQLETFYLEKNLGQNNSVSRVEIEENATDLFSASTVKSLEEIIKESANLGETEREARQNLLNIVRLRFLKNQTNEIAQELKNCQDSVSIKFQNETLNVSDAFRKISISPDAPRRKEIFVRLLNGKSFCANLFVEKISLRREETKALGFANFQKLSEELTGLNFYQLSQTAQYFLEKTEKLYFRQLSELAIKSDLNEKSLYFADFLYLRNQLEQEKIFDGKNLRSVYARLLENFNFSEYKIPNIVFKQVPGNYQTKVFRVRLPEEIYFCVTNKNGVSSFIKFLRGFGEANQAAWTSKKLVERFPEFVFSPDACLSKAYGFLFQTLLTEETFLRKTLRVENEKLSALIKRENQFWLLFEMRREMLRFVLETQIFSASENLEVICRETAKTFTGNLGFRFEEQQMLWEISENFSSLTKVRAFLFAFGLREYLRERYGFDWWQKRKAFEELIDFWNTAERYKAERMAQMIGFETSFDLVAENFKAKRN